MSVIYGLDEGREHTEHIATASQCGMEFPDLAFPGKFLVDSLPFRESSHTLSLFVMDPNLHSYSVKYLPSCIPLSPRRQARQWRETADKVQTLPYSEAKRRVVSFPEENFIASVTHLQSTFLGERSGAEVFLDSDIRSSECHRVGKGAINANSDFIHR